MYSLGRKKNINRRLCCTSVEIYCVASLKNTSSEILEHAVYVLFSPVTLSEL